MKFPQNRGHVALDGLHGEVQAAGDFFAGVAASNQSQHFLLPRGELIELGVRDGRKVNGERVEHESGEPRREHGVAVVDALNGVGELYGATATSTAKVTQPMSPSPVASARCVEVLGAMLA